MDSSDTSWPERPAEDGQTWSIAEVERDTGLGKDTLRVWERRYGFPDPGRDKQGERAYPLEQVQRLRLIKRALDVGLRPGKVVPLSMAQLQAHLHDRPAARREAKAQLEVLSALEAEAPWLRWLAQDRNDLIKQALQQQILRQGLGTVVETLIAPLCVQVGEAWLRGGLSVYQEHLFTETVQAVLREAIASVDAGGQALQCSPRVLLTTTPTEQHGLGLLMAECQFALESCVRFVLGTCTPIADMVLAVQQLRVDVLALSFSSCASRRDVAESLHQLSQLLPPEVEIWVGGAGAALHSRALPAGVTVMGKASDVCTQVQAWRQRHGNA